MKEKEDSKSTLLGALEVNTGGYFFFVLKSKWLGKSRTIENVKLANKEIIQCYFFLLI